MRKLFSFLIIPALVVSHSSAQITATALLDTIQHTAFNYFWNEANPSNGLIKDRSASGAPCSIAAVGFGLTAICIGVDHDWVTREAARDRVVTTLRTFWTGPQGYSATGVIGYQGFFYHFLEMGTAARAGTCELSTIDTGLLLAGILDAKQFFTGSDSVETRIRALADSIYRRMNWNWFRNFNPGILMEWTPERGFSRAQWVGYNEASIMYILALGSPTYPIDYSGWQAWTYGYSWQTWYGQSYVNFPPLFGHQYSQCWLDCRNINDAYMSDRGITYFENSRRATLAQRAYSIANPLHHAGYSDSLWGITASDVPGGYMARGAPPGQDDDGTIAPTAPISSIPFAPEVVLPVARNMWNNYRARLWTPYGFRDAFNLNINWWDSDIIGIDQGPMIIMIENYRTQAVWNRFMKNPDVQRGLQQAGFLPITDVSDRQSPPVEFVLRQNYPNPFNPSTEIRYSLSRPAFVSLMVYNILAETVAVLVSESQGAGEHTVMFDARLSGLPAGQAGARATHLPSGIYFYTLRTDGFAETRKMLLLR